MTRDVKDLVTFTVALTTGMQDNGYEYLGVEIRNADGSVCDQFRQAYGPDGPDGIDETSVIRAVREMAEEYVDTWLVEN